jgi:hypothetical protein
MAQTSAAGYPVQLTLPEDREVNRWWGLLWFGMFVRSILAIPHLIVLWILSIVFGIGLYIVWIPILIFGKSPQLWCTIVGEFVKRNARVSAYVLLFPGGYPPLGMGEAGPVDLKMDFGDRSLNRLWGIPGIGMFVRFIVVIPQLIVAAVLGIVLYVLILVLWIPILVNGRYADQILKFVGIYLQYSSRVLAYLLLLPVPYPPITEF